MAKKKLYTRIKNLVPTLVERGKIKIGVKGAARQSQSGSTYQLPQKIDHFRVVTMVRGADGNFVRDDEIHKAHGEKPVSLPIRLLYDDIELNFQTRLTCYNGQTQWCSGDNESAFRLRSDKTFEEVPCPCPRIEPGYTGKDKCKFNGCLSVIIEGAAVVGGVWKFRTTSYNSVVGILSSLAQFKSITGGALAGIPLNMTLSPKTVVNPVGGQLQTIYVVGLEYLGNDTSLQKLGYDVAMGRITHKIRMDNVEEEARKLLGTGDYMDNDTVSEFYPESDNIDELPTTTAAPTEELKTATPGKKADMSMYGAAPGKEKAPAAAEAATETPEAKAARVAREFEASQSKEAVDEVGEREEPDNEDPPPFEATTTVDEVFESGHEDWDQEKYVRTRKGNYDPAKEDLQLTGYAAYVMAHRKTWPEAGGEQQSKAKAKWNSKTMYPDYPWPLDKDGNVIPYNQMLKDSAEAAAKEDGAAAKKAAPASVDQKKDPVGWAIANRGMILKSDFQAEITASINRIGVQKTNETLVKYAPSGNWSDVGPENRFKCAGQLRLVYQEQLDAVLDGKPEAVEPEVVEQGEGLPDGVEEVSPEMEKFLGDVLDFRSTLSPFKFDEIMMYVSSDYSEGETKNPSEIHSEDWETVLQLCQSQAALEAKQGN